VYGMTVAQIREMNNLTGDISVHQYLKVKV
jgi:hypothetical protein